ncbi:MAG TPA: DUF4349 domain-containing protein [Verrucomicrobiae bacterium]|jgi:hypothetical protein|nr:DUF4349 domain-containing protein [Verrucomicrobiae bacterium]
MAIISESNKWARQNWWKIGLIILAVWTVFYIAVITPLQHRNAVASRRSIDPDSINWNDPASLLRQASWRDLLPSGDSRIAASRSSRRMGAVRATGLMGYRQTTGSPVLHISLADDTADRKTVRTAALDLEVKNPAQSAEQIRSLAEQMGGYLVNCEVGGDEQSPAATITVRAPAAHFEEARTEIKKLATRVEGEKADVADVTKDYVDREARLRNLRAAETQYLAIMKRASTTQDTLEVSSKLGEVRGEIEEQQAEFVAIVRQVETVAITVSLHAEADAHVFGFYWRPMYQIKLAARDGVDSLATYVGAMTAVVFELPAIILWLMTIALVAAIGWRILRWVGREFFVPQSVPATPKR